MRQSDYTTIRIIITALAISLSVAVIDASIGIIITEAKFIKFRSILLPIAVTAGFSFLLLLALWSLLGDRMVKRFGLQRVPAAISLGVFIGVTELLISINYYDFNTAGTSYSTELIVFLIISIFALLITYYTAKK